MRNIRLLLLTICLFAAQTANAHVLEELWAKYYPQAQPHQEKVSGPTPGKIIGKAQGHGESGFEYPWKYRSTVYEMHFENPEQLARGIYSLALHARDVDESLPVEKFYGGVLGFHYSAPQVAAWLNDILKDHKPLSAEENAFAGLMLQEGVVKIGKNGFEPGRRVTHVLGAAPGKKRTFERNLHHERMHVFWDEDKSLREKETAAWQAMNETEKAEARKAFKNYAKGNEKQLVEEWAISRAEKSGMSIR